ncbi:MAG: hypothetical protein GY842_11085 [bacterium]|nr:hypothetical protein [bacterium]
MMSSRVYTVWTLAMLSLAITGPRLLHAQPCDPQWDNDVGNPGITSSSPVVYALTVHDDALYVGGDFSQAGGVSANNVAKWDGSSWSALSSGTSATVWALNVYGGNLIAAGAFGSAGGQHVGFIAEWNGSTWSPLGSQPVGMNIDVNALAVFDGDLYAGGAFNTAGGQAAFFVAKWDGNAWSAVSGPSGNGLNGTCYSVAATDTASAVGPALYAGGIFTTAGGVGAPRVAKWNGSTSEWSGMGSGMNTAVFSVAIHNDGTGNATYAGGQFSVAGGDPGDYVAKWNGAAWSALGSGLDDDVWVLASFDDGEGADLYAGGDFGLAGGGSASHVAKWDGASWAALGAGTNDAVYACAVADGTSAITPGLYVGGVFTQAGGQAASCVARWGYAAATTDCNTNDIPDECELEGNDCNSNGTPDDCELGANDCNNNDVPDECDVAGGTSPDCNSNLTPDECDDVSGGDYNTSGGLDLDDFAALVDCLGGPDQTPTPSAPECLDLCIEAFDDDSDGDVDLEDFREFQEQFAGPV